MGSICPPERFGLEAVIGQSQSHAFFVNDNIDVRLHDLGQSSQRTFDSQNAGKKADFGLGWYNDGFFGDA